MKYSLLALSLLFVTKSFSQGIEFFHGTWQEAIEVATNEDKIIFVDAYTTWCGPCKRMSKTVFTQAKVGEFYNSNFLNVKLDMEKMNGREFGSKYPVSAYPTLFFLEPNGKLLKKSVGGKQADALLKLGEEIISKFDFSAKFREAYEGGDRSYQTVFSYVEGLNKSGKSSLKIANDYLKSEHNMTKEQMSDFLFAACSESDSKIFELMLDDKKNLISKYGQQAWSDKLESAASKTVVKAIKYEDENLFKSALSVIKKNDKSQYKTFEAKSKMSWAVARKDVDSYVKASKNYSRSLTTVEQKIQWAKSATQIFPKDMKLNKLAYSVIKDDMQSSVDKDHITFYCKLLLQMGSKEEALAYAQKAQLSFKDKGVQNYMKGLIKFIENYKTS